jgi:hypothetical protein
MSNTSYQRSLARLLYQTSASGEELSADEQGLENYRSRPENTRTEGYQAPPPDAQYSIVSPLTEVSRVEESFEVAAGGTVYVPTQITMTDANGTEFVLNLAMPTIE